MTHQPVFCVYIVAHCHLVRVPGVHECPDARDSLRVAWHVDRRVALVVRRLYAKQVKVNVTAELGKIKQNTRVMNGP